MKALLTVLTICVLQFAFIYGSGGTPPPPPFLSTEVSGLPHQAPLFFADTNTVTVLAQLSFFSPSSIEGNIDVEGTNTLSMQNQTTQNFKWNVPGSSLNLGMNINAGNNWAFFLLVNVENGENGLNANADLGASILMSSASNIRARLDFGFSSLSMDMETKFLYTAYEDTTQRIETQNDKSWDPFVSLTLNTAFDDWVVNPFLQASFCFQTVFNIDWSEAVEIYSNINVLSLSPGITYRINKNILLVVGGSYFIPSKIENKSSPGIFSGFLQTNFQF
jgi:hypothetical protein